MSVAVAGSAILALVIVVAVLLVVRERRQLHYAKLSLARLAASEERLSAALRGSDDGIWDWDIVNDTRWYSPRWWSMLGYLPNELPANGELWTSLAHPDSKQTVPEETAALLQSSADHYTVEFELRHKQGHYVPILARGYIQRDTRGKAIRLSGTNTDLTERRRAAQERETFDGNCRKHRNSKVSGCWREVLHTISTIC